MRKLLELSRVERSSKIRFAARTHAPTAAASSPSSETTTSSRLTDRWKARLLRDRSSGSSSVPFVTRGSIPPKIILVGFNKFTMLAKAVPKCVPASVRTVSHSRSWDSAAEAMVSSERPWGLLATIVAKLEATPRSRSIRTFSTIVEPEAYTSKQPRLPQEHRGPVSSIVVCPNSPAIPSGPE